MLEPASPQEGYEMMRYAFDLSERYRIPVIIREVQSYSALKGPCRIPEDAWQPLHLDSQAASKWISSASTSWNCTPDCTGKTRRSPRNSRDLPSIT